ncbi:acyltransferase family protein [Erwinia pyrifoliae]|uniref:acyltransferase family protein n=1 Tax=Erwinia pyrifoliae TaxID=79967 RepID=UPI00223B3A78|nr:acyltransferase [Erwinia pyrifoliae]MCT2387154.1 acyltransferase [Erwinia pyrifoliae]MCU8587246.1 acyltransferase [Erwinia pyrifoliae]
MKSEIVTIQWLRGLAALSVVIQHTAFKSHQYNYNILTGYNIGSFGVDLFFIISGFIMCHVTSEKTKPTEFLKKRLARILPLYWVLSLVALVIYIITPSLVNSSGGNTDIISSIFLLPTKDKLLIQNGWSLSYELFFYSIILISLLSRKKNIFLLTNLIIFALVLAGLLYRPKTEYLNFATNTLLIEFSMGSLAYYLYEKIPATNWFINLTLLTVGIAALTYQYANADMYDLKYRFLYAGTPMLLILLSLVLFEKNAKMVKISILEKIGFSSYSLYLSHAFVLSASAKIISKITNNPFAFACSLVFLSVIFGFICYKLIEIPLSKAALSFTKKH